MDDQEQAAAITELVEISDAEVAHSERIYWIPSCIEYILLWLLEDDVKLSSNSAPVERADVEEVLGLEIEEYEVASWEDGLEFSIGDLVENNSSSVLSTGIG